MSNNIKLPDYSDFLPFAKYLEKCLMNSSGTSGLYPHSKRGSCDVAANHSGHVSSLIKMPPFSDSTL